VEVAADLGLTDNAVRQARFRVLRRLREELDGLV
jgi:DNA-directed RNA polymerase specialized sigma24 family protein